MCRPLWPTESCRSDGMSLLEVTYKSLQFWSWALSACPSLLSLISCFGGSSEVPWCRSLRHPRERSLWWEELRFQLRVSETCGLKSALLQKWSWKRSFSPRKPPINCSHAWFLTCSLKRPWARPTQLAVMDPLSQTREIVNACCCKLFCLG